VDWRESVPKLLQEARQHIATRMKVEKHIADTARERLETLELGNHEAEQVARIADIMGECFERHVQLHGVLIGARGIFFSEQERQAFVPRPTARLPNLFADVLEPLLASPVEITLPVLEKAVPALLGTHTRSVFSLSGLIIGLLRPRRETLPLTLSPEEEIWLEGQPDKIHYPPELRQAAQHYLRSLPTQLSRVLEDATNADESQEMLEYLTLTALHAFEDSSETNLQVENSRIEFEQSGFYGDDLTLHEKTKDEQPTEKVILEKA
jgi:hypothetical protein